jgi:NADPH-dependent ferric siderophore reductase
LLANTEAQVDQQYGTVVRTEQLTHSMVRIVFGGEGLAGFTPTEFTDQYVNALFLPKDSPYEAPFDPEAVRDGPPEHAPRGRRETIRRWDPETGEVTIDLVTHGDEGYAGRWALNVQVGDRLQMTGPNGGYAPRPDADWHLLVGDESALPAIGAALDAMPAGTRAVVVAVVDSRDDDLDLTSAADLEVVWVHRAEHVGDPDLLLRAVEDLVFPEGTPHVFVHGEAGEVRAIRKHLVADRGIPKEGQSISPYWRREHTDEQWRKVKGQWLAESENDV